MVNKNSEPEATPMSYAESDSDAQKRSKKERVEGFSDEEGKKSANRLWSEDDDAVVLKGILEFKEKKGLDPMTNSYGFHDFIKKSLQVKKVDRKQVMDKVRNLKKRYESTIVKKKIFSPREQSALDLSAKIWGKDAVADADVDPPATNCNIKPRTLQFIKTDNSGNGSRWKFIGKTSISMGMDENMVKAGLELCSKDSKIEMDNKWKQFYLEESDFFMRKLDLASEETRLISEALTSVGK